MKTCSSDLGRPSVLILILQILAALSQTDHEITYEIACFNKGPTQAQLEFDSEEMAYIDFDKKTTVFTLPAFFVFDPRTAFDEHHLFRNAMKNKRACLALVTYLVAEEKNPPENRDPPETVLYPAEEVTFGTENTLVCFVNHFFPPSINVSWTKNDQPVSEGVSLSRYYPNSDLTFHQFSTLTFTPHEGDIYTCTVEHVALESPKTRYWEADVSPESHLSGLDIYCGVGLGFSLLGVAIGTFLIVKGLEQMQSPAI